MRRILLALLLVSVFVSAWGLFLNTAIAGDFSSVPQVPAEEQVLPAGSGWGQQPRALGVAARPAPTEQRYPAQAAEEEERGDNSYSSSSSSDED